MPTRSASQLRAGIVLNEAQREPIGPEPAGPSSEAHVKIPLNVQAMDAARFHDSADGPVLTFELLASTSMENLEEALAPLLSLPLSNWPRSLLPQNRWARRRLVRNLRGPPGRSSQPTPSTAPGTPESQEDRPATPQSADDAHRSQDGCQEVDRLAPPYDEAPRPQIPIATFLKMRRPTGPAPEGGLVVVPRCELPGSTGSHVAPEGDRAALAASQLAAFVSARGGRIQGAKLGSFYTAHPSSRVIGKGKLRRFCENHPHLLRFEEDPHHKDGWVACARAANEDEDVSSNEETNGVTGEDAESACPGIRPPPPPGLPPSSDALPLPLFDFDSCGSLEDAILLALGSRGCNGRTADELARVLDSAASDVSEALHGLAEDGDLVQHGEPPAWYLAMHAEQLHGERELSTRTANCPTPRALRTAFQ